MDMGIQKLNPNRNQRLCMPSGNTKFSVHSGNARIIKVVVQDDGIGIPKEQQDPLFRRNENYCWRGTSGEKSTDMGLPLLKNLVDAHGGNTEVESEEGNGAAFTVLLPELNPND